MRSSLALPMFAAAILLAGCGGSGRTPSPGNEGSPHTSNDVYTVFLHHGALLIQNPGSFPPVVESYWMFPSNNPLGLEVVVDVYDTTQDAERQQRDEARVSKTKVRTKGAVGPSRETRIGNVIVSFYPGISRSDRWKISHALAALRS